MADPAIDSTARLLARRIRVALGREPGDLLLTGGRVVNGFTRAVVADVIIADGWVAGVGRYDDWTAASTINRAGRTVIPGLIDTHMHLESTLLTPGELARVIVPLGTMAVVSDSHEIGNVLGVAGIDQLARAAAGLPLDVFFMASSCVPATAFEDAGAALGVAEVSALLARPSSRGRRGPRRADRRAAGNRAGASAPERRALVPFRPTGLRGGRMRSLPDLASRRVGAHYPPGLATL